jgi:serine/threonine protein kinase
MEYAEGGDLLGKIKNYSKSRTSFSESEVVKMFVQMVAGLKVLHDRKILHRDIKVSLHLNVVRQYIPNKEQ